MPTITATGNFLARPNRHSIIGPAVDYHFHHFAHTVLPLSGLWRVRAWRWTEDQGDVFDETTAPFVGEVHVGPALFATARPDLVVEPWVLIEKDRWHKIDLVSKTAVIDGHHAELEECEFWCCWSYRTPDSEIVEYQTGWEGAFK